MRTVIFEDELFTKTNAKDLLLEQRIALNDEFEIIENKSMSGIGDYYHTFTLKISTKDRLRLIKEIAASENFKKINEIQEDITQKTDKYTGWIFRCIVRRDSATKYATHSEAKYPSIPLERLPIIPLQSTPLC